MVNLLASLVFVCVINTFMQGILYNSMSSIGGIAIKGDWIPLTSSNSTLPHYDQMWINMHVLLNDADFPKFNVYLCVQIKE